MGGGGGGGGTLALGNTSSGGTSGGGGGGGVGGPTPQQRAEAQALMASTETMMKFGFMSMSLTYFSSLNMVRAMRQMGTANTVLASNPMLALIGQMGAAASGGGNPAAVALAAAGGGGGGVNQLALMGGTAGLTSNTSLGATSSNFSAGLRPGSLPGQEPPEVRIQRTSPRCSACAHPPPPPLTPTHAQIGLWTVADVSHWLDSLALGQYKDALADAAVDGAFLCELTDEDLRNTLGIEHALHRKKICAYFSHFRFFAYFSHFRSFALLRFFKTCPTS